MGEAGWRSLRVGVGGLAALVSGAASYALAWAVTLACAEAYPRLAARWLTPLDLGSWLGAALIGVVALGVVVRAPSGPALVRRLGGLASFLGAAAVVAGIVLLSLPQRPPVHPGALAAADASGGLLVLFALLGGVAGFVAGGLLLGAAWIWARRRSRVAGPG